MKKKRKLNKNRLILLLCIPIFCLGLVGMGIHHIWDHYEQKNRREFVQEVIASHDRVAKQIREMQTSDYVDEQSFEKVRELAVKEDRSQFGILKKYEGKEVRIEDDDFENLQSLKKPNELKFYRLMKLCDEMKDEGQSYFNFVLDEPDSRIGYALQFENRENYQEAPKHLGVDVDTLPAILQWDTKWGFIPYGDMRISFSGCAPTSLSMVLSYLNQDDTITPAAVAKFSEKNGFYVNGVGTSHALLNEAAKRYDVQVEGVTVDSASLKKALKSKKICIASVRPGDFTHVGHFIVIAGMEDGKLVIHDPNSKIRTQQLWDIDRVLSQTQAIWAYYK